MTPVETENPHGGYGKTISHLIIGLKTTKGSKSLKLDPTIYENIQKEKIQVSFFMASRCVASLMMILSQNIKVGDVIYIEANNGAVKRVGRSDTYSTEYDLEADEFVPIPKGDVHKELFLSDLN